MYGLLMTYLFYIHFLWRRENESKETFPHPRPSPEGRMQTEDCRNRQSSARFGKPGHGLNIFMFISCVPMVSSQF